MCMLRDAGKVWRSASENSEDALLDYRIGMSGCEDGYCPTHELNDEDML